MHCIGNDLGLSNQARSLWAKTGKGEQSHLWESLPIHLADTAAVSRMLWNEWLPESTKQFLCACMSLTAEEAEVVSVWLAHVHDIGKATPSFQSKVAERAEIVREAGLELPYKCENKPHSLSGQIIFQEWLERHGWAEGPASGIASIVGGHHGAGATSEKQLDSIKTYSSIAPNRLLGNEDWTAVQNELLDWAYIQSGAPVLPNSFKDRRLDTYAQIQLTALAIVADWIASNTDLVPLAPNISSFDRRYAQIREGWASLGLPEPLAPIRVEENVEKLFHRRFACIPSNATLRPIQAEAVESAKQMVNPGLLIIEAPMGCGKTEAALLCAEILIQKYGAGGIAYLLPTQATSNAMFARVKDWLSRLLEDQPPGLRQNLHLLHGKAELNDDYAKMQRWRTSWMGDESEICGLSESIVAHQWFFGRKRALLAPFVVGTVDQLLMAALRTKHVQLRHLGLAEKVVIVDEVHAYDAYMNVYLDRVLAFLGAYHVPVILLSATLPPSRRAALVNAYAGCDKHGSRRGVVAATPPRLETGEPAYPLVTVGPYSRREQPCYSACTFEGKPHRVHVEFIPDSDEALLEKLREMLTDGGCACVLRDTVSRAQAAYKLISDELDVDVRLLHARFIATDRVAKDAELLSLLGPESQKRPKKMIVVATQVVEQSLDVDFDLLITDIAPIDLILQRIGRLHRHPRGVGESARPQLLRMAHCVITGVTSWGDSPPLFATGIDSIYQPEILWKSIKALWDKSDESDCILLPADIAPLVESVYEDKVSVPSEWKAAVEDAELKSMRDLEVRRNAAEAWLLGKPSRYNLNGWMRSKVSLDDEVLGRAVVRDSSESIEVVVVKRGSLGYEVLPWVSKRLGVRASLGDGSDVPDDETAHAAALCTVGLPPRLCASWCRENVVKALESRSLFKGWQESRWLAGLLPLVVDNDGYTTVSWGEHKFVLRYSRSTGLSIDHEGR